MVHHSIRRCLTLVSAALALSATARAQTQVYVVAAGTPGCFPSSVLNTCHGPAVHLLNTVTGHDLATVSAGSFNDIVTSLRLSSDGGRLFLTIASLGGGPGRLSIIDTLTRLQVADVNVGGAAEDVAILPDSSRAYVVNGGGSNSVSVVDLTSFTVVATIAVQSSPERIVVSADGTSLYVTNRGAGTVSKISAITNTVAAHIPVGTSPTGLDISPDGSRVFVANSESNSVSVIDAANDSVLRVLSTGSTSTTQPQDVSAQSATRVYVTAAIGPLQLLSAADGAVIGSASIGGFGRLARDSSGTPVFVVESGRLTIAATDGTSVTTIASGPWTAAAVVTDHCAFEATATATVFGPAGGSGILRIPAPAGCTWTIDPSGVPGLSVAAPLSGTGAGTRAFTVPSTSIPRLGTLGVGRQAIAVEQTIPRMNVELSGGVVQRQPFTVTGWAFDENAFDDGTRLPYSGVDQVHVWAYPDGGGAPILVDVIDHSALNYGLNRPDVAAVYGFKYLTSGFTVVVSDLPPGSYMLAFFAHSNRSNMFSNVQTVNVTVQPAVAQIVIDVPAAAVVNAPFLVAGWAVDAAGAAGGPGVDVVHVWAYPSTGASPVFLGQAAYGGARPDVASYLGSQFTNCGYGLTASLAPGDYTLVVFARSAATKQFRSQTVRVTVQ